MLFSFIPPKDLIAYTFQQSYQHSFSGFLHLRFLQTSSLFSSTVQQEWVIQKDELVPAMIQAEHSRCLTQTLIIFEAPGGQPSVIGFQPH